MEAYKDLEKRKICQRKWVRKNKRNVNAYDMSCDL
jgi:hypothetical protein